MHEGLKLYFEYNHLAPLKKKKKSFISSTIKKNENQPSFLQ